MREWARITGIFAHLPASSFALHALERASLEVSAHPLAVDGECAGHGA